MKLTNIGQLGETVNIRERFQMLGDTYFLASHLTDFDTAALTATLHFRRNERKGRYSFGATSAQFAPAQSWTFPPAYPENPAHPIRFSFHGPETFRILTAFDDRVSLEERSGPDGLMVEQLPDYAHCRAVPDEAGVTLTTEAMEVRITFSPFAVDVRDRDGRELTRLLCGEDSMCLHNDKVLPLSYVRALEDRRCYSSVSLRAAPGEHFYGCGESFTGLDKRGQLLNLWTKDPHGCQTEEMYKPVPFYQSSRGYGVFLRSSAPLTFDLGHSYQEAQTLYAGEDCLDLFVFAGTPEEILTAYTALTGRPALPPVWSFGLWMSRITYRSEEEVRQVAQKLREHRIPCDVIHLDTGWFELDWGCDYRFSPTRFPDPAAMIADLRERGLRVSLWQLPYFTPANPLYGELCAKGLAVKAPDGGYPTEDLVLDFSNPETVEWYGEKLGDLLELGVAAIKTDFGEAAPLSGSYHAGRSGWQEHNLYPLRYNRAAARAMEQAGQPALVWARSSWAGGQRHPVHWGGDTENTDMGMLSVLRGGLSLGMSGFSFWSNDMGGFVRKSPEELYGRWGFLGMFTSHMRAHGAPPKEPWEYSTGFLDLFRRQMAFRYRLTPYVLAQSVRCAALGHPVARPMVFAFPRDITCQTLEDQYMFGQDILVAPLFEANARSRQVWLPEGGWLDLFTEEYYRGGCWQELPAGDYNGVALVREDAAIPMVDEALTTDEIDWSTLRYRWYTREGKRVTGTGLSCPGMEAFPLTDPSQIR